MIFHLSKQWPLNINLIVDEIKSLPFSWYITHLLNAKIENSSFLGDKDNNYQCNTWCLPFKTAVFSGHRIFYWNRFASFSMQTETWKWSKTYLKIYCGLKYILEWISVWSFSLVNHTQKNIEKKLILYTPNCKELCFMIKSSDYQE